MSTHCQPCPDEKSFAAKSLIIREGTLSTYADDGLVIEIYKPVYGRATIAAPPPTGGTLMYLESDQTVTGAIDFTQPVKAADPVATDDLATKGYVDTNTMAAVTGSAPTDIPVMGATGTLMVSSGVKISAQKNITGVNSVTFTQSAANPGGALTTWVNSADSRLYFGSILVGNVSQTSVSTTTTFSGAHVGTVPIKYVITGNQVTLMVAGITIPAGPPPSPLEIAVPADILPASGMNFSYYATSGGTTTVSQGAYLATPSPIFRLFYGTTGNYGAGAGSMSPFTISYCKFGF